jgi:hypothetical protein
MHARSVSIGRLGEKYYLMIVIDGIDFVWPQTCQVRTHPEDLLHEFLTMSRLKISTIRFDGVSKFGKSSSFIAYCTQHDIVREPLASYTHIQNARAEGAIRICKEHVRCLLRSASLPRRFWPDALRHFCRLYAYWPDANGLSAWEKLIIFSPTSCVTIWSKTCMFLARTSRVICLAHILTSQIRPTMIVLKKASFSVTSLLRQTSRCIVFVLARVLTDADIRAMHAADGHEEGDVPVDVVTTRSQAASKLRASGELPAPSATSNAGEKVRELSVSNRVGSMIDDMLGGEQQAASSRLVLQDYKKFKHGKEVPQEAEIQYLKQHLLAQALVHHKHAIHMLHDLLDPNPTNIADFIMMASRAYSTKNTWYVEYEVTGPP